MTVHPGIKEIDKLADERAALVWAHQRDIAFLDRAIGETKLSTGLSWADVGFVLGITGQMAARRASNAAAVLGSQQEAVSSG